MHMELPQYATFTVLKAFAMQNVRIMQGLAATRKRTRAAHIVERREPSEPEGGEDEEAEEAELCQRLMDSEDPAELIEILAFMRASYTHRPRLDRQIPASTGWPMARSS